MAAPPRAPRSPRPAISAAPALPRRRGTGARWSSAGGWAGQPPGGRRAGPHTREVLSVRPSGAGSPRCRGQIRTPRLSESVSARKAQREAMAEPSEPGRQASAGGGSLEEEDEEDEEREPLLPRIAWAQPQKGAPGGAVRLEKAVGEEGAASPNQASDRELLLLPRDASFFSSLSLGCLRSSPTSLDRNHPVGSGAIRLFPSPAPCQCACRRRRSAPHSSPSLGPYPRLLSLSPASPCLVGKALRRASGPAHRPRGQPLGTPWTPRLSFLLPRLLAPFPGAIGCFT